MARALVCQIRQLRESLDKLWCAGDVVLFTWINFLQNDVVALLSISSPLSVSADGLTAIIDHDAAVYKQVLITHHSSVCLLAVNKLMIWLSGNELVLGWVTVCGRVNQLGM